VARDGFSAGAVRRCGAVAAGHARRTGRDQGQPRRELGELELPQRGDVGDRLGATPTSAALPGHIARRISHTRLEAHSARRKASASGSPLIDGNFRVRHDTIDSNDKLAIR
jgi:hypothetical protein